MPDAPSIVTITGLSKTYASGFHALKQVDLTIRRGEIFALLGPNGAGKTTLINVICGIVNATSGSVTVDGDELPVALHQPTDRDGGVQVGRIARARLGADCGRRTGHG